MSGHAADLPATLGRWYVRHAPGTVGKAQLAARLNSHLKARPRHRIVRTRFGAAFEVDTVDLIQRYIYLFGTWEPHLTAWLQSRLRPGDTFIDVGANLGYFSLLGADLVGRDGTVVAIEASPDFHEILLRQLQRNGHGDGDVRALNAAVSEYPETLTFVLASNANMGANSIVPWDGPAESSFEIDAEPLPDLLTSDELSSARVIKIDVEGAEGGVMKGLLPALDKLRPDAEIAVEMTPGRMAQLGHSAEEVIQAVRDHGFHVYRIPNDYAPSSYPAAVRRPTPPVRWEQPITRESEDLIFSRADADYLR